MRRNGLEPHQEEHSMSSPKPHIRPKAEPYGRGNESPLHDPVHAEHDPPVFTERDPGTERKPAERVIFQEDDCLR
jgi:hypothetical protein